MINEIEKIVDLKDQIIEDAINWQKLHYPSRTSHYDKCKRDIKFVIDAYILDISNNTTKHIISIGNAFWVNGVRQIKDYVVEIDVHTYLIKRMQEKINFDKKLLSKLESLKNILTSILKNGPITQYDFLQLSTSMQRCQRNFDLTKTIDDETVKWLYDIGYSTPTKQNLNSFQILAVKDRDLILRITKTATSVYDEWDTVDESLKNPIKSGIRIQNPQVNANLLFLFFHRPESFKSELRQEREGSTGDTPAIFRCNTNFEMGLSASAIGLAAQSIGLKTGFCRCFNREMLDQIVSPYGLSGDDFSTALGVGYPIIDLPHYVHTDRVHTSETLIKEEYKRMIL